MAARRAYLAFIRAGSESLHRRLIAEDPARNWDCCVSWYVRPVPESDAEYYSEGGDNKLEGFLEFHRRCPVVREYRFVMVMDDDVYLEPGALSRFFELCERYGTWLAQPAQRWRTNNTLKVLVRNPVCLLRRVSFVDVMAPCFSAAALEELLPTFSWTKSTWGVDWAWGCLAQDRHPLYVVDAIALAHTRRGDVDGGAFYRKLRAMGVDAAEELRRVRERFPRYVGPRTLPGGHVYRRGIPPLIGAVLWRMFEHLKWIVRLRKQGLRQLQRMQSARG